MESVPYKSDSSLCPKLLKGQTILLPLELTTECQKFKDLRKAQQYILGTLDFFLDHLQKSKMSQNNFFYASKKGRNDPPLINDICLVLEKGLDGNLESDKIRIGKVIAVGKTSAELRFKNKYSNSYPYESLALICREPSSRVSNSFPGNLAQTLSESEQEEVSEVQPNKDLRQIQLRTRTVCANTQFENDQENYPSICNHDAPKSSEGPTHNGNGNSTGVSGHASIEKYDRRTGCEKGCIH